LGKYKSRSAAEFLPLNQARLFVQRLGFKRKQEWNQWKMGKRPALFLQALKEFIVKAMERLA